MPTILAYGSDTPPDDPSRGSVILELVGEMQIRRRTGQNLLIHRRKSAALLAALALAYPSPVGRTRLCELLWSNTDEHLGRALLRQEVRYLLDLLQSFGAHALEVSRYALSLSVKKVWIDVVEIRNATPEHPVALDMLNDRLLVGLVGVDPAFDRYVAIQHELLEDRAKGVADAALLLQSSPEDVIAAARRLLLICPIHESATRTLMRAHADRGEQELAIAAYERCRNALRLKFDVEPSPETVQLASAIRGVVTFNNRLSLLTANQDD